MHFKPGEVIDCIHGVTSEYVYYIDKGTIEIRWEADLPVSLEEVFENVVGNVISHQISSTAERLDSTAFAEPKVKNLKISHKSGASLLSELKQSKFLQEAERSAASFFGIVPSKQDADSADREGTLEATAELIINRANEMLQNAAGGSVDNLLISKRTEPQFLGALSMFDPEYFGGRWCCSAIASDHVRLIKMDKEGLERFLVQNPLSQVHLRASMAVSLAEIAKLEALEKIALAQRKMKIKSSQNIFSATIEGATTKISDTIVKGATTAKLDLFALVGKLREALGDAPSSVH